MKWLLALVGVAIVATAIGALLFRANEESPGSGTGDRLVMRVRLPADAGALGIEARRVSLYDRPEGRVIGSVDRKTEFGSPEILQIVRRRGQWVAVRHTSLGNDRVAWVKVRPNALSWQEQSVRLEVDLSDRELKLKSDDTETLLRTISVAIGAPDTPTPPGEYYVTDKLRGPKFGPYYGCCILALSGHQPNLPQGWSGGDRLAIHGSPTPTWGKNVSNGCFHARETDLRYLMKTVPLGTPVSVRA